MSNDDDDLTAIREDLARLDDVNETYKTTVELYVFHHGSSIHTNTMEDAYGKINQQLVIIQDSVKELEKEKEKEK